MDAGGPSAVVANLPRSVIARHPPPFNTSPPRGSRCCIMADGACSRGAVMGEPSHGPPADGTWGRVPIAAVQDARLSRNDLRVLIALARYANSEGCCYPAMKTLADLLGMKRQNVNRCMQRLADCGWVEITHRMRANKGGKTSNAYRLDYLPVLEARGE